MVDDRVAKGGSDIGFHAIIGEGFYDGFGLVGFCIRFPYRNPVGP